MDEKSYYLVMYVIDAYNVQYFRSELMMSERPIDEVQLECWKNELMNMRNNTNIITILSFSKLYQ